MEWQHGSKHAPLIQHSGDLVSENPKKVCNIISKGIVLCRNCAHKEWGPLHHSSRLSTLRSGHIHILAQIIPKGKKHIRENKELLGWGNLSCTFWVLLHFSFFLEMLSPGQEGPWTVHVKGTDAMTRLFLQFASNYQVLLGISWAHKKITFFSADSSHLDMWDQTAGMYHAIGLLIPYDKWSSWMYRKKSCYTVKISAT